MSANEIERLRVLIATQGRERLDLLATVVAGLGHEVISREIDAGAIAAVAATELPDVALVDLGFSMRYALGLIEQILKKSTCPVIALVSTENPVYVREAAKRGVYACLVDASPEELQGAIEVTRQRFTEYHKLQRAFARRAVIEQAKGILMGRNAVDSRTASGMLRDHSARSGLKLVDAATAIVDRHSSCGCLPGGYPQTLNSETSETV
jgi:response regulator NasT